MKRIIFLITLTFQITLILADDTNLGSQGGNVFPVMRNKYIRMAKEDVKVRMLKDSCIVTCQFWFKNYSNQKQNVFMGFPDYFLVVWDLARYSRQQGIRYAGRGFPPSDEPR